MKLIILLLKVLFVTRSPLDNNTNYYNSTNPDFVWGFHSRYFWFIIIIPRLYCCKNFEIPKHLPIWTDHQQSSTWSSAHVGLKSCSSTQSLSHITSDRRGRSWWTDYVMYLLIFILLECLPNISTLAIFKILSFLLFLFPAITNFAY